MFESSILFDICLIYSSKGTLEGIEGFDILSQFKKYPRLIV